MKINSLTKNQKILISGDIVTLFLITLIGFSRHQTLSTAGSRIFSTFIPWSIAWILISPLLGVFEEDYSQEVRQLWRPIWAMILASPIAGFLRAIWLGQNMLPLFPIIMGGSAIIGLIVFRLFYIYSRRKKGG